MARTPSSRAGLWLAFLAGTAGTAGTAAAEGQETAKSIPVPSIAAATLPVTGSTAYPAVTGDINTDIGETTLSASLKVTGPAGLGAELGVQAAQSSGGALFDNGDSIASGAQLSAALTYGNYGLLPDEDPGVKEFEAALRACQAVSASRLREKTKELDALREKQKKGALEAGEQDKLAAAEKAGCTHTENAAFWLAERARFKPTLAAVKATLGRSDAVFLADGNFLPTPDLIRVGVTVAVGQYLTSGMVVAASLRWASGNVIAGDPVNICHQIGTDASGNPVTQCDTGIVGSPTRGNLWRAALEVRQIIGNGLIWAPSASLAWADGGGAPVLRTQIPMLFEVIPTSEQAAPLLLGLTVGWAQAITPAPVPGAFTIAGTIQTQFAINKL
ncbi:MAG TPA: hypothetical protein VFB81_24330 [Myxococcales bacterium]|nr:hypothetical protein [Myxococcales bacterium]